MTTFIAPYPKALRRFTIKVKSSQSYSGIRRPTTGGVTEEQFTKHLYVC